MPVWRVERRWAVPAQVGSTDTEGGHGFALRHIETGEERDFAILLADGHSQAAASDVQQVLEKYLDDPDPPQRVTLDRQGREINPSA